jgi:predicted alpha/beta-fold hydrolase
LTFKLTIWDGKDCFSFPPHIQFGTDIDIHVQPGIYYNKAPHRHYDDSDNDNNKNHYQTSTLVQRAMTLWSPDKYTYQDPTPWILTGDARTGLPYLWNRPVFPDYYTVYLTTSKDDNFGDNRVLPEIVAVALAFPPTRGYNASAPFYVVAHGMNGGPEDGYIQDFVNRRTAAGSSVAILLARGLHGMPLVSGQIFSVARTSDLHALAKALRQVHPGPIAGVGYSIGAIVLSHYVVAPQYSDEPFPLDAAFSISGALDARQEATYYRPQRVWLPMIAEFFRSHQYVLPSKQETDAQIDPDNMYITSAKLLHQRLATRQQVQAMMRARHTIDLDENSIVPFYNYSSVMTYYSHQSALGDIAMEDWSSPDLPPHVPKQSQLAQHLKIPLGVLHSLDDPIATWRNNVANTGWMHPEHLVQLNENLVLILTDRGGHVGWPLSSRPWRRGWEFMNEAASSFVEAVVAAKEQTQQEAIMSRKEE